MSKNYSGLAALVVFLLGSGYSLGWHRDLFAVLPGFESLTQHGAHPPEPVMVLLLGSTESVERVRRAIAPERILASTPRAFAIDGGRVVAVDVESASDPLNAAGWAERRLEIMTAERLAGPPRTGDDAPASARPNIAELAQKPTLTADEAMALLDHLD